MSVFVIAEAGVNHNGQEELAYRLIDAAADAGADAVKFQTFKAEHVVTGTAKKAIYQIETTGESESQLEMIRRLELPYALHRQLMDYAEEKSLTFLSTAFDHKSLDFLVNDLGISTLKIPSSEITNGPLLLAYARKVDDIILSTGMSTLGEIEEALGVLAFGLLGNKNPSRQAFQQSYISKEGQKAIREKVTLLHCTTEYPAPFEDINLYAMDTMREAFGLPVGYSDHSDGVVVPIAAAAKGACVIEKHFTIDKCLPGPDHRASLEPEELKSMVISIRTVETVLGSRLKGPTSCELQNRDVMRRSLVASEGIKKADLFTDSNITAKRPGLGLSPMRYWDLLGHESVQAYSTDEMLC